MSLFCLNYQCHVIMFSQTWILNICLALNKKGRKKEKEKKMTLTSYYRLNFYYHRPNYTIIYWW